MLVLSFLCMTLGPHFFQIFADKIGLGPTFIFVWKYARWMVAGILVVLSIELIYFIAPNVRQRFAQTLPGAIVAVSRLGAASPFGLGVYFEKLANFNKTYGTLGAAIALLVWLNWTVVRRFDRRGTKFRNHPGTRRRQAGTKAAAARPR